MIERMKTLVIDDALKAGTEIGPVVDDRQLRKNFEYIEIGKQEGARLAHGGERLQPRDRRLLHVAGDVHGVAPPRCGSIAKRFLARSRRSFACRYYDEALAMANNTPFGLSAGIVTTSLKHASHFRRNVHERSRHGQPADGRPGLSRALWGAKEVELRTARAGHVRERVLYDRQDGLHRAVRIIGPGSGEEETPVAGGARPRLA